MKTKLKKYCDLGSHECDRLFHSRTKERPSCCPLHAPRMPIKPKGGKTFVEKAIDKISKKQLQLLKEYRVVRTLYMLNHMSCEAQLPGCSSESTDIHHKKGRTGKLLLDANYFLAVCRNCHNWIHNNDSEARKKGFLLNRLDQ